MSRAAAALKKKQTKKHIDLLELNSTQPQISKKRTVISK